MSCASKTSFCDARYSAIFTPPSPSSLTTWPAWRGGLLLNDATCDGALAMPTWPASMPASATVSVVSGFFFAAMIPLNEG